MLQYQMHLKVKLKYKELILKKEDRRSRMLHLLLHHQHTKIIINQKILRNPHTKYLVAIKQYRDEVENK